MVLESSTKDTIRYVNIKDRERMEGKGEMSDPPMKHSSIFGNQSWSQEYSKEYHHITVS